MCVSSFFIRIFSKYAGQDKFGNKYYYTKKRRFVVYKGIKEPTKVPPLWHAWLHFLSDKVPNHEDSEVYTWQKSYMPNVTGTSAAHHMTRKIVSSDYQSWKPN